MLYGVTSDGHCSAAIRWTRMMTTQKGGHRGCQRIAEIFATFPRPVNSPMDAIYLLVCIYAHISPRKFGVGRQLLRYTTFNKTRTLKKSSDATSTREQQSAAPPSVPEMPRALASVVSPISTPGDNHWLISSPCGGPKCVVVSLILDPRFELPVSLWRCEWGQICILRDLWLVRLIGPTTARVLFTRRLTQVPRPRDCDSAETWHL